MLKTIVAAFVVALVVTGLATASAQNETYAFKAKLSAGAEVPKPTGVPSGATGSFGVTTVEPKTGKVKLSWKLTFTHLSGGAIARTSIAERPVRQAESSSRSAVPVRAVRRAKLSSRVRSRTCSRRARPMSTCTRTRTPAARFAARSRSRAADYTRHEAAWAGSHAASCAVQAIAPICSM